MNIKTHFALRWTNKFHSKKGAIIPLCIDFQWIFLVNPEWIGRAFKPEPKPIFVSWPVSRNSPLSSLSHHQKSLDLSTSLHNPDSRSPASVWDKGRKVFLIPHELQFLQFHLSLFSSFVVLLRIFRIFCSVYCFWCCFSFLLFGVWYWSGLVSFIFFLFGFCFHGYGSLSLYTP